MSCEKARILFICRERVSSYGISTGLLNSALFLANYLADMGIRVKVAVCKDANEIDRQVHLFKPTHVVIHAIWVPPYKMEELLMKYTKVKWQIRVHSKIPFLANEGIALEWLCAYIVLDKKYGNLTISGNSIDFCHALKHSMNVDAIYLPNIYHPKTKAVITRKKADDYIDIGCFGAVRPLKNNLIQAMAAISFGNYLGKKIRFHINSERVEQSGEQPLKNLRALFANISSPLKHELVEHGWLEHDEFLELVSKMDMGMQVSLTETFNIVAADFVYAGVPVVVSPEIEWMPPMCKANPTNINDIRKALDIVWKMDYWIVKKAIQHALKEYNEDAARKWLTFLNKDFE